MSNRSRCTVVFLTLLVAGVAEAAGPTPPLVITPCPSEVNQALTLTADASHLTWNPIWGTQGRTIYRYAAKRPNGSVETIRDWSDSKTANYAPASHGTYTISVTFQLKNSRGDYVGNPIANPIIYTIPATPLLSSPADAATVNGDNGVTFSWTDPGGSGGSYEFCLSTNENMGCTGSSAKTRSISTTSTSFSKTDLTGFTGVPLWWVVRAKKSCSGAVASARRSLTINVTTPPSDKLTWNGQITALNLGQTPSSFLQGKTISKIINSLESGRSLDSKMCNACHTPPGVTAPSPENTPESYRPPATSGNTITPTTQIRISMSGSATTSWSAPGGFVDKFCGRVPGLKPSDLCTVFTKWKNDGYRP